MTRSEQFLVLPGGRLAYQVEGRADTPLVLAVHGMGSNRHAFRLLTPAVLTAGFRVASVDVRGHGDSSTGWPAYDGEQVGADVVALVRELGGPAVLIGSSVSAAAVTFAAASAPREVSALVLVGATAHRMKPNLVMRAAQAAVLRNATLWGMYYRTLFKAARPADFDADTDRLLAQLRQKGRMAAVRGVLDPTSVWWIERAPELTCPVQVIMGTKDPDFADPAAEARATVAAFTATPAELTLVEGAGHYPFLDSPRVTNEAITGFLAQVVRA